jgi:uncharacterized protein (TIGR02145 family)
MYYVKVLSFVFSIYCFYISNLQAQTVKDIDGNIYHTLSLGQQEWMLENLRVTHYSNGENIPRIPDSQMWSNLTSGALCSYDSSLINLKLYGEIYNWFAVSDARNVCPSGWHVPSDAEWTVLTDYLGGENIAGGKLKEKSTAYWKRPNSGATNESGFLALPGGFRNYDGIFYDRGYYGFWWSATKAKSGVAWGRGLYYFYGDVNRDYNEMTDGFSVRCVRDVK